MICPLNENRGPLQLRFLDGQMFSNYEGFYAAYFTGQSSGGFALLAFVNGSIVGSFASGGRFDGQFKELPSGVVEGEVMVTLPPGGQTILGTPTGAGGFSATADSAPQQMPSPWPPKLS